MIRSLAVNVIILTPEGQSDGLIRFLVTDSRMWCNAKEMRSGALVKAKGAFDLQSFPKAIERILIERPGHPSIRKTMRWLVVHSCKCLKEV